MQGLNKYLKRLDAKLRRGFDALSRVLQVPIETLSEGGLGIRTIGDGVCQDPIPIKPLIEVLRLIGQVVC